MLKPKLEPNVFLSGNYAPVHDELTVENLEVIGEIPQDLLGIYMRNGPNPAFEPIAYHFPFDGDGMIHAVYIAEGKAHYRNRYVKTTELLDEQRAGKAIYGSVLEPIMPDPKLISHNGNYGFSKEGAYIHIIHHANRYLAMDENSPPYEINAELETLARWCPVGSDIPLGVAAHTRWDPETGELWLFKNSVVPPSLTVYKLDNTGNLKQTITIDKTHATVIHDFVITKNYILFFDCPLVIDPNQISLKGDLINWRPQLGTRIGILPKNGGKITWHDMEAFLVLHFANAYESNGNIIIDYVKHSEFDAKNLQKIIKPSILQRTTISLQPTLIKHEQLEHWSVEYPRIREDRNSQEHQFIYLAANKLSGSHLFNSLMKYDAHSKTSTICDFGKHAEIGEAIFVARENSTAEDDGYVILFLYNAYSNSSELTILNAQDISSPPLARIKMPRRVPHGIHGSWMNGMRA